MTWRFHLTDKPVGMTVIHEHDIFLSFLSSLRFVVVVFFLLESIALSGLYLHRQVSAFVNAYLLSLFISFAIEILLLLVFTYTHV